MQLLLKQLDSKWQESTKANTTGVWSGYLECCSPLHLHSGIIAHFFLQSNHKNVKCFILRRSFQERAKESQKKCLSDLLVGGRGCGQGKHHFSLAANCLGWEREQNPSPGKEWNKSFAVREGEAFGQAYGMCFRLGGRQKKNKNHDVPCSSDQIENLFWLFSFVRGFSKLSRSLRGSDVKGGRNRRVSSLHF